MHKQFLLSALFSLIFVSVAEAQKEKVTVEWHAITGKDNEFAMLMPKGYKEDSKNEHYLGKPPSGIKVEAHNFVYRYINGVVLMMEYYKGKIKDIQPVLLEREKLNDVAPEIVGDFAIKRFSKTAKNLVVKIDHYVVKDRLYVIKTYSDTEKEAISLAFRQSVRLAAGSEIVAPNAPKDAKTTSLPKILEISVSEEDTQILSPKDVDREAIVIQAPRPSFTLEQRQGRAWVLIKLRLLLSATGKVTDVTVISSSGKMIERPAIETAKRTIFIPAQKGGRLVSTYKEVEYKWELSR